MSGISEAGSVRDQRSVLVEIIVFFGALEVLHFGMARLLAGLFSWLSETWYPVCVRSADLLLLFGLFGVLRRWRGCTERYPKGLTRKGAAEQIVLGIVLGTVFRLVADLALLPRSFWHRQEVSEGLSHQWAHFPWFAVMLFFGMGALREEAIWRGYVLEALERQWGSGWALFVSAVGFGLWHLNAGRSVLEAIEIALNGGMLMGAAYLWCRRLWLPIGLHIAMNVVSTFLTGYTAFPQAALPPVTLEVHGALAATQLLVYKHIELIAGSAILVPVVLSGRWKAHPHRAARS